MLFGGVDTTDIYGVKLREEVDVYDILLVTA
jgi:hypothetical protein